jgi:hypothetical protein
MSNELKRENHISDKDLLRLEQYRAIVQFLDKYHNLLYALCTTLNTSLPLVTAFIAYLSDNDMGTWFSNELQIEGAITVLLASVGVIYSGILEDKYLCVLAHNMHEITQWDRDHFPNLDERIENILRNRLES